MAKQDKSPLEKPYSINKGSLLGRLGLIVLGLAAFCAIYYVAYLPNANAPVNEQQLTVNQNAQADETADWKTYTNTEFGFQFKYPEPLRESDEQFSPLIKDGVSIEKVRNYIEVDPIWVKNISDDGKLVIIPKGAGKPSGEEFPNNYKSSETKIGGRRAIVYEKTNPDVLGFIKEIKVLDFPSTWGDDNRIRYQLLYNSIPESVALFDKILSTFVFVDPVSWDVYTNNYPKDWKTYSNDEYNFELKYPVIAETNEYSFDSTGVAVEADGELILAITYASNFDWFANDARLTVPVNNIRDLAKYYIADYKTTTFAGATAYRGKANYTGDSGEREYIIFQKNGKYFRISYPLEQFGEIPEKVLSSIKFD